MSSKKPSKVRSGESGSNGKTLQRTGSLPKSDGGSKSRVKHQIGFVINLLVLKGLTQSANGMTMQISWKEERSRNNYATTSVKVVKKKEIEWGENLVFDSKLSFSNGKYSPAYLILSLKKVGSSSTIDRGTLHLHELALSTESKAHKVVFAKGEISLTYTAKATPKQFGNQKVIAPTSQVSHVDEKHRIVSHGIEWATQTAKDLTETAGGSFGSHSEEDFDFASGPDQCKTDVGASNFVPQKELEDLKIKVTSQEKEIARQQIQIDYLTQRDKQHLKEIKELKIKLAQTQSELKQKS